MTSALSSSDYFGAEGGMNSRKAEKRFGAFDKKLACGEKNEKFNWLYFEGRDQKKGNWSIVKKKYQKW